MHNQELALSSPLLFAQAFRISLPTSIATKTMLHLHPNLTPQLFLIIPILTKEEGALPRSFLLHTYTHIHTLLPKLHYHAQRLISDFPRLPLLQLKSFHAQWRPKALHQRGKMLHPFFSTSNPFLINTHTIGISYLMAMSI